MTSNKIQQFLMQHAGDENNNNNINYERYSKKDDTIEVEVTGRNIQTEILKIPKFDSKNAKRLIDKSVIFYGPSGSGKTQIIYDFMFELKDVFPIVIVFAPTNREKRDYDGYVPTELIYEEFGLEDIKRIYDHQKAATRTYSIANDLKYLKEVSHEIITAPQKTFLNNMLNKRNKAIEQIKLSIDDIPKRKTKIDGLEETYKEHLRKFYKEKIIKPNRKKLLQSNLNRNHYICVKYVNFNPRILVIFDDAMTEILTLLKEGAKSPDGDVIKNFFFKGRWSYITHFYAFQDDNKIDSGIKKNAFYSIFTKSNVASAFFNRSATNFSPQDKARVKYAINSIFPFGDEETDENKYRKILYAREEKDCFQHITANTHDTFEMCSNQVRKYCTNVKKNDEDECENNPFFKKFTEM